MHKANSKRSTIILAHIVPSFFFGMIVLIVFVTEFKSSLAGLPADRASLYLLFALATSAVTTLGYTVYSRMIVRRFWPEMCALNGVEHRRNVVAAYVTVAVCGGCTVFLLVNTLGILVFTAILSAVILTHIKRFGRTIRAILRPGALPTARDVWRFIEIYINVLAGFTLLNASLNLLHVYGALPKPQFSFGNDMFMLLDSLYFSVVTMTTLGFGDVTPLAPLAKMLTIFECLTGYVMFALAVGLVTRGVTSSQDDC